MQLNFGRFLENKSFGYVLRPAFMRETGLQNVCATNLEISFHI
jgi:hypothetical protein